MSKNSYFKIILLSVFVLFGGISCGSSPKDFGVYKSSNSGEEWDHKVKIDDKKTISNTDVVSIKIDPSDSNIVYIGTKEGGVYKTTDGAETWQQTTLNNGYIYAIDIDPKDTSVVYAAGYFGTLGKIFKSSNGGADFNEIYSETHEKTPVMALAIDTFDTRKIYAGTAAGSILKSIDSGRSWILQQRLDSEITQIAINPKDTRHILVGTESDGVFKTINGGEKWNNLEKSLSMFKKVDEVHSLAYDPRIYGKVYFGSSFGLLVSNDEGESWQKVEILTEPASSSIVMVAIDYADPSSIYLGIDSAMYKTSDNGESWEVKKITSGLISAIACDSQNYQIVYAGVSKEN